MAVTRDPYRDFAYEVEIDGFVRAGFSKVSGFKQTTEVIKYREGGDTHTPRKMPGQTEFENIVLERGLMDDTDMLDWSKLIFDLDATGGTPPNEAFRKQPVVYQKDKEGNRVWKHTIYNAWPTEFEHGDLDASANGVRVTRLVLANEGIKTEKI